MQGEGATEAVRRSRRPERRKHLARRHSGGLPRGSIWSNMTTRTAIDTIRSEKIDALNDLLEITRDSASVYSDAASKVPNPQLKTLFGQMAESRSGLVVALSEKVRSQGEVPAKFGTVRGTLSEFYTDVRSKFGDANYGYVCGLEAIEDRLPTAFNNVVADNDVPAPVKSVVSGFLPTIRQHHDLMRDRKWAMQPNA